MNAGENEGKLQADEDEYEAVDRKGEGVPEAVGLHTYAGREELRLSAAEVESASDDGEDAGCVGVLRRPDRRRKGS